MSLTEFDLDSRKCKHCGELLRDHATEAEGAWFVTPCNAWLRSVDVERWDLMVLDDGATCRWCCQLLRVHFVIGEPSARVALRKSVSEVKPPAPRLGQVVPLLPLYFTDCRTDEQRAWVPPPPPKCHADGSPFGYRNPWATA